MALAALDLEGRIVSVESAKGLGKEDIVKRISALGTPVLFASDVNPAPDLLLKLASAFNASLFIPAKSLSEEEKRGLASAVNAENVHERDALACARKAFHSIENKLRQADRHLREQGIQGEELLEAKRLVLGGVALNLVVAALKARKEAIRLPEIKEAARREAPGRKPPELLELARENLELRKKAERLEAALSSALEEASRAKSAAFERARRDRLVLSLEAEVARLKRGLRFGHGRARFKKAEVKKALDIGNIVDEYRKRR